MCDSIRENLIVFLSLLYSHQKRRSLHLFKQWHPNDRYWTPEIALLYPRWESPGYWQTRLHFNFTIPSYDFLSNNGRPRNALFVLAAFRILISLLFRALPFLNLHRIIFHYKIIAFIQQPCSIRQLGVSFLIKRTE